MCLFHLNMNIEDRVCRHSVTSSETSSAWEIFFVHNLHMVFPFMMSNWSYTEQVHTGTADPFHMWTNFGDHMSKRSRVMLDKTDRQTDKRTNEHTCQKILASNKPTNEHTCQKILASNNASTIFRNVADLSFEVHRMWNDIPRASTRHFINSCRRHVRNLLVARGDFIGYWRLILRLWKISAFQCCHEHAWSETLFLISLQFQV